MTLFSQNFDYENQWKIIENNEKRAIYKSNLPLVKKILSYAKNENNTEQYIKSLLYYSNIVLNTQDDEFEIKVDDLAVSDSAEVSINKGGGNDNKEDLEQKIISLFYEAIHKSKGIQKVWFQNILAQKLYQYYLNNQWQIQGRTYLKDKPEVFKEWSSIHFKEEIINLFTASLENKKVLLNEKTDKWKYILIPKKYDKLNPSLYHVLVDNYINFLKDIHTFKWTDEEQIQNAEKTKSIYNIISNNYLATNELDAFLFTKENFLKYQLSLGRITKKEYIIEIEKLISPYSTDYTSQLLFNLANYYKNYNPNNKFDEVGNLISQSENIKKAFILCERAINKFPNSKWTKNNVELKKVIEWKDANISIQKTVSANLTIPIGITHKNVDELYVRVYDISSKSIKKFIENKNKKSPLKVNAPLVQEFKIKIQKFDDFSTHKTIYKLNNLPSGEYKIALSNNVDFKGDTIKNFVKTTNFLVSKFFVLSNLKRIREGNSWDITDYKGQIVNRETGKALANTYIEIYDWYSPKTKDFKKIKTITTDDNGFFYYTYNEKKDYGDIDELYIYIPSEKEFIDVSYFSNNYDYNYNNYEPQTWSRQASIFTDRAIYRPGQTLYFKSIVYKKLKTESKILKNTKVKIELKNVNYETVSELELISNDFGSVFGEFILPNTGLTGNYTLTVFVNKKEINSESFKVEEYKRPKFEVTFEDLKGEYTLNNKTEIKGNASAFSGAKITEAKVIYRVTRTEIYPFPLWDGFRCYIPYHPYQTPEEITHGETITNEKGEFIVKFITKAKDKTIKDTYPQTFLYTISADVTDINGETHSADITFSAGDIPKKLNIIVPKTIVTNEVKDTQLIINSTNLNEQKVAAKGQVKITKLIAPKRITTPNVFPFHTNYNLILKEQLEKYFPHLSFNKKETDKVYWKKGEIMLEKEFINPLYDEKNKDWGNIKSAFIGLEAGNYVIETSELYGKDTIRAVEYIEIYDAKTYKSENNEYLSYHWDKTNYKVGETAKLVFLSDTGNGEIFYTLDYDNLDKKFKKISKKLDVSNGKAELSFIINPDMGNGTYINYHFIKFNDYKNGQISVPIEKNIPFLTITTKTFRDKIKPGIDETWELTISGKDKDKVTAELLATMYDASLDEFTPHSFYFSPKAYSYYSNYRRGFNLNSLNQLTNLSEKFNFQPNYYPKLFYPQLRYLNPFGSTFYKGRIYQFRKMEGRVYGISIAESDMNMELNEVTAKKHEQKSISRDKYLIKNKESLDDKNILNFKDKRSKPSFDGVKIRKNLQETAFFFPNLYTDKDGNIVLKFITPEALTQWKLLLLAHTQNLVVGQEILTTQTEKELMVVPNPPRFLRENDQITFNSKISNLSDKSLKGNATLQIFDAFSMQAIDNKFNNENNIREFKIDKKGNTSVSWNISIPENIGAIVYRIIAKTDNFSDGEENSLPILTNRTLVTETLPISIKEGQTKTFTLDKLKNNTSTTLQNFNLTLKLDTNPIWLAVMSLPYLRESSYECSEQIFSRLYGNMVSHYILNSSPKIKAVFEEWNKKGVLKSKLEQNEELKNILLEETPWLREAESEEEQMKRIALFFDLNKMLQEFKQTKDKLISRQMPNGSFSWFDGGKEDLYITRYIVAGFGKLKKMTGEDYTKLMEDSDRNLIKKAIDFIDTKMLEEWKKKDLIKNKKQVYLDGYYGINQFLYARSFWLKEYPLSSQLNKMKKDYFKDALQSESKQGLQSRALFATVLQRYGHAKEAKKIIFNLKETSVESEEMGMYWKNNFVGWHWHEAPIETQSYIIEAFNEIAPEDEKSIENMKVWLIKNKQTNSWSSTKSTVEAVYSLMTTGKTWLNSEEGVTIKAPQFFIPTDNLTKSGLIKTTLKGNEIKPESGSVEISKTTPGIAFGGFFWQYFENLDKITKTDGGILLKKELFLKKNTDKGPELQPINEKSTIKIGDLVAVRLVIKTDRDMEYIHIKDMRASGFEPVNVISSYKWQNGLGYYESTRDASTNFFISYLQKGTYIFEYELRANNMGNFSNGITTLQNMYAPEMSAHSKGIRVHIN